MKVRTGGRRVLRAGLPPHLVVGLQSVALLSALSIGACGRPADQAHEQPAQTVLITEEEAVEARVDDADWVITERFRGAGPEIVILEPQIEETAKGLTAEVGMPFDLRVKFEQAAQPVDMASLQVRAKVGILPKVSLTKRLLPYMHEGVLDGRDLTVPKGKYLIEISIADTSGAMSRETIRVKVR